MLHESTEKLHLRKKITEKLVDLSKQTKIPMSPLIEEGIEELLKKYERKGLYNAKKTNPSDYMGKKYGRLLIKDIIRDTTKKNNNLFAICECECGNEHKALLSSIKFGSTKSCGCYKLETTSRIRKTHGMSETRFYKIWQGLFKRCDNPNDASYINYGGRGIKISSEWYDFANFKNDLYEDYLKRVEKYGEENTTIEREDVNGNYEPNNCTWATIKEQSENTRSVKKYSYKGKMLSLHQISDMEGINYRTFRNRIFRSGMSIEQAVKHKTGKKIVKNNKRYEYRGEHLRLYELSERFDIHPATLADRLKKMNVEEAVSKPVKKRGRS